MDRNEITINLEEDLNAIARLIWSYMDKKYISQLKVKLDGYRRDCEGNLSREAQLMRAMIPFVPEEKKTLQFLIDALVYNDMIEKGFEEHQELQTLYRDQNKEMEKMKKLMYKLIMFKLMTAIEKGDLPSK